MVKFIFKAILFIIMVNIVVIHTWEDAQKEKVFEFANRVVTMAKEKKLPRTVKLISIDLAENKNVAVCHWEAESLDQLMQLASQLGPTWKIDAFTVKNFYKKGLL